MGSARRKDPVRYSDSVARDHALEDGSMDRLPLGSEPRVILLPLLTEVGKVRVTKPLLAEDGDNVSSFPWELPAPSFVLLIQGGEQLNYPV